MVDEGAGLTRLGARSYDAELGSFISPDPVIDHSDSQQMHAFSYANNSPVSFTDPDGLFLRRTFARARAWAAQRARCFVPGVMEALKPGKDQGHASTEEVPR